MQLFINGKAIDVSPSERVAITFQRNDLADISKANTSYTNKFKIPKTPNNVNAFEYLGVNGFSTRVPYRLNDVSLVDNSIQIIYNGYAEIVDSDSDSYNINIYGAEKTFFEQIKGITLQDVYPDNIINWTAENLKLYTTSNINFCFPIAQYNGHAEQRGSLQSGIAFCKTRVMSTSPYFFVKQLFQNIFSYLGYTVSYPIVNDSIFTKLVMPSQLGVSQFLTTIQYGQPYNIKNSVPQMAVTSFLKEIMYRFQLVIKVDEFNKRVHFKQLDDIITSNDVVDWSDKYDALKNEKYAFSNYGQNNHFIYANDVADENFPDINPANILRGSFPIDNETLDKDKTIITSEFIKPKLARQRQTNDFAQGRIYFPDGNSYYLYDNAENTVDYESGDVEKKENEYQILHLSTLRQGTAIRTVNIHFVRPDGSDEVATAIQARAAQLDNISFQEFLDNNYPQLINLLDNVVIVKCMMNLNLLDIHNFDFFSRVYLKQFSSYFYVNKITNWEKNKAVEVELIKIPAPVDTYYNSGGGDIIGEID